MKHSDFKRLDLFILDGAEYRLSSHDTDGIVVVGIAAPHIISADERREQGCIGADVLIEGPAAVKEFLRDHIGRGRYGNDYHKAFGKAFNQFYFRKDQPPYRPVCKVMAEYVGENFRFTGQEKVFGILTRGIQRRRRRSRRGAVTLSPAQRRGATGACLLCSRPAWRTRQSCPGMAVSIAGMAKRLPTSSPG